MKKIVPPTETQTYWAYGVFNKLSLGLAVN